MARTNAENQKAFRDRRRERATKQQEKVQKAIDTMPPEYAADCKMWVSPPAINGERPQINWDIGRETAHLIKAHANSHGVTIDEVLYEIGVQFFIGRPKLYAAMKSAKINVSSN